MSKPVFVAEVASNHHRNLQRCLQFVDVASNIGCSVVKFQLFKIEELFASEILQKSSAHRARKQWELPVSFLPEIAARCFEKKIKFSCTPFYLKAVAELFPYVDYYKIASYELLWKDLLRECARTGKPVVLSTGMATINEIKEASDTILKAGCQDITLLHCVSDYPTPASECNLAAIETLRKTMHIPQSKIQIQIGWSDHSVNPGVIYRAVYHWGAEMVEFHLDLDEEGEEYKTGHCWLPDQIELVIKTIKSGIDADGTGEKIPSPSEIEDRDWRADPSDGLRPLLHIRGQWVKKK